MKQNISCVLFSLTMQIHFYLHIHPSHKFLICVGCWIHFHMSITTNNRYLSSYILSDKLINGIESEQPCFTNIPSYGLTLAFKHTVGINKFNLVICHIVFCKFIYLRYQLKETSRCIQFVSYCSERLN